MRPLVGQEMLPSTQQNQRHLASNVQLCKVGAVSLECSAVMYVSPSPLVPDRWLIPYRAPTALESHYPLTVARSSYLTSHQAPSPLRSHHMLWLSGPCHGPMTHRFVH